jgi:hypothetical protein
MNKTLNILLLLITLYSCKSTEPKLWVKNWDYKHYEFNDSTMHILRCYNCKVLKKVAKIDSVETMDIYEKTCFLPYEVSQMRNLKYLAFFVDKLKVDKKIKELPYLKTLWFWGSGAAISKTAQCWFIKAPNLELLSIDFIDNPKVLEKIAEMKHLKYLQIGIRFFDSLPKSIQNLKNLERLRVGYFVGDEPSPKAMQFPKFISQLTKLKELHLSADLSDNIQYLDGLNDLKTLSMFSFEKFDSQYLELKKFEKLEHIDFDKTLSLEQWKKIKKNLPNIKIPQYILEKILISY